MEGFNIPQFSENDPTNIGEIVGQYINTLKPAGGFEIGEKYAYTQPRVFEFDFFGLFPMIGLSPIRFNLPDETLYTLEFEDNLITSEDGVSSGKDGIADKLTINFDGKTIFMEDRDGKHGFYESVEYMLGNSDKITLIGDPNSETYSSISIFDTDPFLPENVAGLNYT